MSSINLLNTRDEQIAAIQKSKKMVIFFGSKSCPHCVRISPSYDALSKKTKGITFYKVEAENKPLENIKGVPTFSFYKNGQFDGTLIGPDREMLETKINTFK